MIYWVNITEPGNFVYPGIILEQKTIKITDKVNVINRLTSSIQLFEDIEFF